MTSELTSQEINDGPQLSWLVRKCEDYYDELKECKNMRARFHQHFIYGESLPCDQWETDYKNCMKFRQTRSEELRDAMIESERVRVFERLSGHLNNDTWKKRKNPPENWNKPLPERLQKRADESRINYLYEEEAKKKLEMEKKEAS